MSDKAPKVPPDYHELNSRQLATLLFHHLNYRYHMGGHSSGRSTGSRIVESILLNCFSMDDALPDANWNYWHDYLLYEECQRRNIQLALIFEYRISLRRADNQTVGLWLLPHLVQWYETSPEARDIKRHELYLVPAIQATLRPYWPAQPSRSYSRDELLQELQDRFFKKVKAIGYPPP